MARRSLVLILFVAITGCAAVRQQKAIPAATDNLEFHNLRVLSPTITHDELIATMRGFARSLGTRCEHCHVQTATEPRPEFDFPNDSKPEKKVARQMIAMVRTINADYLTKVNAHGQTASCMTCHRGHTVPDLTQVAQPGRPGGQQANPPQNPEGRPEAPPAQTPPPER